MGLTDCLREVVQQRYQLAPESGGSVCLRERGVMQVQVSGLATDSLVLRMEKISLSGINDGRWKRSCDYAIVSPGQEVDRVLFIELKRTMTEEEKGLEQLLWSLPRFEHLRSVCRIVCGNGIERAKMRYALLAARGNPRLDKQPIKRKRFPHTRRHEGIKVGLHIVGKHESFDRLWTTEANN